MLLSYRDPEFWPRFQSEHWRPRRPTVLRAPFREFPFDAEMVLRAIDRFQACRRAGDTRIRHLLSTGKSSVRALARRQPATMGEWEQHCRDLYPRGFGIMVNNLQAIEPGIWKGVSAFLQDAYPWVDYPVARTVLDLFFGGYSHSFLGLHKDTQEIFGFVVRGEKVILAWPFEYFTSRVKGLHAGARFFQTQAGVDYRKYRKDAIVLRARPGDVIYWPSEYWHIAEGSPGEYATMLSLGLFLPQYTRPATLAELRQLRERLLPAAPDRPGGLRSGDVTGTIGAAGAAQTLRWATSHGFRFHGPAAAVPARSGVAAWRKKPEALLLWCRARNRRLLVAANGYSATLPGSPGIVRALESLAGGETTTPGGRAVAGRFRRTFWDSRSTLCSRSAETPDLRSKLIEWLAEAGAIEPAP